MNILYIDYYLIIRFNRTPLFKQMKCWTWKFRTHAVRQSAEIYHVLLLLQEHVNLPYGRL